MECECPRQRGHKTVALPAKVMEVTLTQATEIRKRTLEMALPAVQRTRLARMDMLNMWLGVGNSKPSSGSSSDLADERTGRGARHDDADRQSVPGGADEKHRKSSSANFESSSGGSETRLRSSETNKGKESCAGDKMLTIAQMRMKETMLETEQANIAVEVAKKKVGLATGVASDVAMLLELLRLHLNSLLSRRMQRTYRVAGWPWAPFPSQNSEWSLFGRNGPFGRSGGSNFRCGSQIWSPLFSGQKKHQSWSVQKNHLKHAVDRPTTMHVVWNILFRCTSQKCIFFDNSNSLIFCTVFSTVCGTVVEENEKTQGDRN